MVGGHCFKKSCKLIDLFWDQKLRKPLSRFSSLTILGVCESGRRIICLQIVQTHIFIILETLRSEESSEWRPSCILLRCRNRFLNCGFYRKTHFFNKNWFLNKTPLMLKLQHKKKPKQRVPFAYYLYLRFMR